MQKLLKFYFRHKKLCLAVIFFAIAAVIFVLPHTAFAETKDESTDSIVRDINGIFNTLLRMSSAWLWPVLIMTGSLLDNDLIFGGAMGERLLDIWVQIRNLVNIAFVLILLAIAVYNVLGIGEEGGGLPLAFKTAIPKFVLALIAVNFSFLAVKVILDFTNVITGAVFALPTNAITQEKQDFKSEFEKTICGYNNDEMPLRPLYCDGESFNAKAQSFFSRLDRSNITLVYALRFGKAANLKFIRNDLQDIGQLGFNIIFNSILYIVYAVSFIVLFLVLLLRIVSLWVIVVLSPLIALGIVLPNLKELAGEGGSLQEKFLNDAIAPIKIGLVLSVSYIMLSGFEADKSIHGELLASASLSAVDINSIPTDIIDLQQLMIAVGMIVVIWVGVFSAAEKSTAKGLTGWIKGKLEGAGQFMASLPAYLQVIPVGGKRKDKPMSLSQIGGTLLQPFKDIEKRGRYREPGMGGDTLHLLGKDGNLSGYMDQLKSTPGGLATKEGVAGLIELLDKKGQGNIARQIKSMDPAKDTRKIVDAIYAGTGEVSTAFKNFKSKEALIDEISRDKAAGSGTGEGGGTTGPSAEKVVGDVHAKDADVLAKQPEFKGWRKDDVDKLKVELEKIEEDEKEGVIVIENGVVNKVKTMKNIRDAMPRSTGTGGGGVPVPPLSPPPGADAMPASAPAPATGAIPTGGAGAGTPAGGTPATPPTGVAPATPAGGAGTPATPATPTPTAGAGAAPAGTP